MLLCTWNESIPSIFWCKVSSLSLCFSTPSSFFPSLSVFVHTVSFKIPTLQLLLAAWLLEFLTVFSGNIPSWVFVKFNFKFCQCLLYISKDYIFSCMQTHDSYIFFVIYYFLKLFLFPFSYSPLNFILSDQS